MIRHGVAMLRNYALDFIFIQNLPKPYKMIRDKEVSKIEHDIKWFLQQDGRELSVRYYDIPQEEGGSKIVIHLGGCKRITDIVSFI